MKSTKWNRVALLGAVALLLAACSAPLFEADEESWRPSFSRSASVSTAGDYLVVYRSGPLPERVRARIEAAGGTVVREIPQIGVASVRSTNPGFADAASSIVGITHAGPDLMLTLDLPEAQIIGDGLDADGLDVEGMEVNDNDLYETYQWDIKRVGGHADTWAIQKGAGAVVAVLDTGVYATHPDLEPNYAYGTDFTDITVPLPPGWIMWDQGSPQDYSGHGTHVAGAIAGAITSGRIIGVAPEASIANYKVLVSVLVPDGSGYMPSGIGYLSWILGGIVTAADDCVHVINMSLGGGLWMNEPGGAAAYVAWLRATQYARQQGALVVAASGNWGLDVSRIRPVFFVPSGTPAALSVNATGPDDSLADYSNYGSANTRVVAPGGDRSAPWSSLVLGANSPLGLWKHGDYGPLYVPLLGTSFAAPKVAGVAALIYAHNPGISPAQVETLLMQTADPVGGPGFDPKLGHGIVDAYAALTSPRIAR